MSKKVLLGGFVLGVYLLHQDVWNWERIDPLVFGILPAGLAYHVGYSILAAIMMAVLVRIAWPKHLENVEPLQPGEQKPDKDPHA
jgi:hypothetical protein